MAYSERHERQLAPGMVHGGSFALTSQCFLLASHQKGGVMHVDVFLDRLKKVHVGRKPRHWTARCPAHEDKNPSLSIGEGQDGKILLTCHAGCTAESIVQAVGCSMKDMFPDGGQSSGRNGRPPAPQRRNTAPAYSSADLAIAAAERSIKGRMGAEWSLVEASEYVDSSHSHCMSVCRFEPDDASGKTFLPIGRWEDGWRIGDPPGRLPLYRGCEVNTDDTVFIVEGEKAADAGNGIGLCTVTSAHGSSSAKKSDWSVLAGHDVVLVPDNDEAGEKYVNDVGAILANLEPAPALRILRLEDLPDGGDVFDRIQRNREAGASDDEIARALRSAAESAAAWTPPAEEPKPQSYNLTDIGNGERLVELHGHDLRHCKHLGGWFEYDGSRWRLDCTGEVDRRAKDTIRAMMAEATAIPDDDRRAKLIKHALRSEGNQRVKAMIERARREKPVAVMHDAFDRDPWLLNISNGSLDLRTGALRPHAREDLIRGIARVQFDPDARSRAWEDVLDASTGGDTEVQAYLARAVGYSLTGDTREDALFLIHGPGATGKSTFLEAVKGMLGSYGKSLSFAVLTSRRAGSGPSPELACLDGARAVFASESPRGQEFNAALLKSLTGGETISVRHLHKPVFEFRPTFKIWLACNDLPWLDGGDSGVWRRMNLVPFRHRIAASRMDRGLRQRLQSPESRAAILAWAVRGLADWEKGGLRPPAVIREATAAYEGASDPFQEFLDERCDLVPEAWESNTILLSALRDYLHSRGAPMCSPESIGARLSRMGFEKGNRKVEGKSVRGRKGIRLKPAQSADGGDSRG